MTITAGKKIGASDFTELDAQKAYVRRSSDSAPFSGGALTAEGTLKLSLPANTEYEFLAYILFKGAASGTDFNTDFTIPAGADITSFAFDIQGGSATYLGSPAAAINGIPYATTTKLMRVFGIVKMGATAGTIQFRRSGTNLTIVANSFLRATRVA